MKHLLEQLPNELFLQIFAYFDLRNLQLTFWGLNSRLNTLLLSIPNISIDLENSNDYSLIEQFARQISRLKISLNQTIDLSEFTNIHFLELCRPNDYQFDQIRSDLLPNLFYLSITELNRITFPKDVLEEIFSGRFRNLQEAKLPRLDSLPIHLNNTQCLSLRILDITCTNPNVICQIITICPNLSKLSVTFFGSNRHILPPLGSAYNHNLGEFSLLDSYYCLTTETVEILFLYMPNLKSLNLQTQCRTAVQNLFQTISNSFSSLEQFDCGILEHRNNQMVDLISIQQINDSLFQCVQCLEKDNGSRLFFIE